MQLKNSPVTTLIRKLVPRSLRNAIRWPASTRERLKARWRHLTGVVCEVPMTKDWKVRCHPLCEGEFGVFQKDPEQRDELNSFASNANSGMQFLDIGAHWGAFALAALHYGGSAARVICIEASFDAAKILNENFKVNGVSDRVRIVNAACGAEVGVLKMLTTGAGGADYFVVPAEERPDTLDVPQVTADSVCKECAFAPTHVKIDVEGFEEEVLRGAKSMLRQHRPIVFLELHGDIIADRGLSAATVLDLLSEAGYPNVIDVAGHPLSRADLESREWKARLILHPNVRA